MEKNGRGNNKGLPKDLLEILACPDDKSQVKEARVKGKYSLQCVKCKRIFEVREGIPIMLPKQET
ncbi:Trm112 family protein [Candidatus Collierbacteria bacterium]|nr:Trm112 family protein [Candidatus Collierbacteria bacterium]